MIIKVSPLLRLPSTVDVFDYFIPPDLEGQIKIGQLVIIPWRAREVTGVVLNIVPSPSEGEVGLPASGGVRVGFRARPIRRIINPEPILTSAQLKLIKQFSDYYFCTLGYAARLLTPSPVRAAAGRAKPALPELINFPIARGQISKLKNSLPTKLPAPAWLQINDLASWFWLIFNLQETGNYKQLLILFPTVALIEIAAQVFQQRYPAAVAIIHSQLSAGSFWRAYATVQNQQAKIILSTRQGVFLPLAGRSALIMLAAESQDFKQSDQHPRYDARRVAAWSAQNTGSDLLFVSPTRPFAPAAEVISLPGASRHKTLIQLMDMKQELQSRGFSIMADKVQANIADTVAAKKKVLVLSLREKSEKGVSVDKLMLLLTKTLKDCTISKPPLAPHWDVLITTPAPLEALKLASLRGKIGLMVIASIEPLLALPDYRAAERAYNKLRYWQMLAQELQIPKIILQSYSPDSLAVRAFADNEEEEYFYQQELKNRRQLNYPPFSELIKLSYRGADEAAPLAPLPAGAAVRGPYTDGQGLKSFLLKINGQVDLSSLRALGADWIVDREPENVL